MKINYKKLKGILFFTVLILGISGVAYAAGQQNIKSLQAHSWQPKLAGGILRPTNEGKWYLLTYKHQPSGFGKVTQTSDYIKVYWTRSCDRYGIITASFEGDEVFARRGYSVGASIGQEYANLYIYDRNGDKVDPATITATGSNIWGFVMCKES